MVSSLVKISLPEQLQVYLKTWVNVHIKPEWVYTNNQFKIEHDDFHITVKYGLHTDDPDVVENIIGDYGPITIILKKMIIFPARGYDILTLGVKSEKLNQLNILLSESLDATNSFDDYIPHITLVYLLKQYSRKFNQGAIFNKLRFIAKDVIFSKSIEDSQSLSDNNNSQLNFTPTTISLEQYK